MHTHTCAAEQLEAEAEAESKRREAAQGEMEAQSAGRDGVCAGERLARSRRAVAELQERLKEAVSALDTATARAAHWREFQVTCTPCLPASMSLSCAPSLCPPSVLLCRCARCSVHVREGEGRQDAENS